MGMRMMFTVFLLVVLATTVVSFTSDRAPDGRNAAAKAFGLITPTVRKGCCSNPACMLKNPNLC
uniref:Omega-conotoxin Eu1.6 n=2 Tax=Conus TaxID=6490 RepID=CA16_CONEB|nr:RecName: Full=Omega-conotoxin Eu1.6; AltName: Full=Alpha-conopeptide Eu1.6; AltName: Full=Alpha-conotoxin Eb1.6; Flags: Precursor [Conus eburneus]ADZ76588.1 alpha-conotoxin Vi1.6 precursor [Conus virgo]ADZ76589.1 alpha-conotoxin Eb1.6 precursor [Conus eburneus]